MIEEWDPSDRMGLRGQCGQFLPQDRAYIKDARRVIAL
jgi:hypothetical protein